MPTILCPECGSENITPSYDSKDEYVCLDCSCKFPKFVEEVEEPPLHNEDDRDILQEEDEPQEDEELEDDQDEEEDYPWLEEEEDWEEWEEW